MAEAPKYFIQIPVLTAKQSDISSTDKLVFGEIYTMLNTEDRCWLTNTGIGNRINKNRATVRNSVKKLKKLGYIKTNVIPNGHEYSKRFTYGYNLGGTKLGTTKFGNTKESTSVVPNKVQQSYQIKYPSKSLSISISKSRERRAAQVNSFLNVFQQLFAEDPGIKFEHYMNRWIVKYHPNDILKTMKYTKKHCRTGNPNAIASYMDSCLKNPMKPKQNNHPKYHSFGDHDNSKYNRDAEKEFFKEDDKRDNDHKA